MSDVPTRFLIAALREIGAERGVGVETFSGDWLVRLSRGLEAHYVVGYHFPLNPSSSALVAGDKAAASEILEGRGVPCVRHDLFLRADVASPLAEGGTWGPMLETAAALGWDLVLKPNEGTGGDGIVRVRSPRELEVAAQRGFARYRSLALSPFLGLEAEVRVVVLDGAAVLTYEKVRPSVVGDGARTAAALAVEAGLAPPAEGAADVPPDGERRVLEWRHNLGHGARPVPVEDAAVRVEAEALALRATAELGLRFASVDVVAVAGGGLRVMEVNAGVMMEAYARRAPGGAATARAIYAAAVDRMFP